LIGVLIFSLATLPTISPVADKEFEAEGINLHARLEADAQVSVIHFVLLGVRKEKREVAGNGEEEVVVEGGEVREFVDEQLRDLLRASAFTGNSVLCSLWKEFIWKFAQPGLEHRADDVYVVQIVLFEEVDIKF